jgi:hypothetical protein
MIDQSFSRVIINFILYSQLFATLKTERIGSISRLVPIQKSLEANVDDS